jgi:hypothetical protein
MIGDFHQTPKGWVLDAPTQCINGHSLGPGRAFRVHDAAIFCCNGPNLEADSAAFLRGTGTHRASPWFRVPLHLNNRCRRP